MVQTGFSWHRIGSTVDLCCSPGAPGFLLPAAWWPDTTAVDVWIAELEWANLLESGSSSQSQGSACPPLQSDHTCWPLDGRFTHTQEYQPEGMISEQLLRKLKMQIQQWNWKKTKYLLHLLFKCGHLPSDVFVLLYWSLQLCFFSLTWPKECKVWKVAVQRCVLLPYSKSVFIHGSAGNWLLNRFERLCFIYSHVRYCNRQGNIWIS